MEAMQINGFSRNNELKNSEFGARQNVRSNNDSQAENRYHNVPDSPENRKRIDTAVRALEIYQPHHPNTRFQYQVHADTGTIQVALINFMTGEVVQEVPSSKLLEFSSRMEELSGLVVEESA